MSAIQKCWMYLAISAFVLSPTLSAVADDSHPTPTLQISAEDARYMMELHLDLLESRRKAVALAERVKREIDARRKRIEEIKKVKPQQSFLL